MVALTALLFGPVPVRQRLLLASSLGIIVHECTRKGLCGVEIDVLKRTRCLRFWTGECDLLLQVALTTTCRFGALPVAIDTAGLVRVRIDRSGCVVRGNQLSNWLNP